MPACNIQHIERFTQRLGKKLRPVFPALLFKPTRESRNRGECDKPVKIGNFALKVLNHLFEQKTAERNASQSFLCIGNRVEDRRRCPTGRCEFALTCSSFWMEVGISVDKATSTKIRGSCASCG